MGDTVCIQKIGDRYGIILPERHSGRTGWKEGDLVEIRMGAQHIECIAPPGTFPAADGKIAASTAMQNYYAALRKFARR
jgi:bifunctional DNA-binding transcriptional regulator/antitoxin component of YhaV-PrlF toxin-antitoxin module